MSDRCCDKADMPHDGYCPVCFAGQDEACINTRTENVVQTHKRRHPSPHMCALCCVKLDEHDMDTHLRLTGDYGWRTEGDT